MTAITTVSDLRSAFASGPESRPLTIWCDGVQVRDCVVVHNIAGCEVRLRTGKPTPTEAETLAEANAMFEQQAAVTRAKRHLLDLAETRLAEPTAAPAAVVTLPADSEPEPVAPRSPYSAGTRSPQGTMA